MAKEQCPHMIGCALYPVFKLKAALKVWQTNYCEADFTSCARFQKSCCGDQIPNNLLPNGKLLVLDSTPGARAR